LDTLIYKSADTIFSAVKSYFASGFNPIPLRCDGSKSPRYLFAQWIEKRQPWIRVELDFADSINGIGILCGSTSGGLEVLDFDTDALTVFPAWYRLVSKVFARISTLPVVQTPKGGFHVWYRAEGVESGRKLAQTEAQQVLIETRGHGNYVVAPGSPPSVHPLQKPYRIIRGNLLATPTITMEQRGVMLQATRLFNRLIPKTDTADKPPSRLLGGTMPRAGEDGRPGDWFNRTATWEQILEPHGWTSSRTTHKVIYWRKPDSGGREHQATTGYGGRDTLHVFSSSAAPFEQDKEYQKFHAFTLLNHQGNWSSAARALIAESALGKRG
jgi:hypothetical protein